MFCLITFKAPTKAQVVERQQFNFGAQTSDKFKDILPHSGRHHGSCFCFEDQRLVAVLEYTSAYSGENLR